jgi:hypothetical protein
MAADPVIMYAKILAKNIKKPMTSDSRIAKRCSRMSFSVEVKSVPFKPTSKSNTLGLARVHLGVPHESYHTAHLAYHIDLSLDRTSIFLCRDQWKNIVDQTRPAGRAHMLSGRLALLQRS